MPAVKKTTSTKSKSKNIDLSTKSDMYKNVKRLWDTHVWTIEQVKHAVKKEYISKEDFKEITNKTFK